jgi:phosphoribosylaminoimidazolecarboxamide formyltransferase/IMP cyclohydrolase
MRAHGIVGIDLVAVNLYPFEATISRSGCTLQEAIENIDIGGPAMLRSAAKNHAHVGVIVDSGDYERVLSELQDNNRVLSDVTRFNLATKVFAHTAKYDAAVSNYLGAIKDDGSVSDYPLTYSMQFNKLQELRYGENPHQSAAFYGSGEGRPGVATAVQHQGKELSYNNLNDTDAALELVAELGTDKPAVAIIKHANPCGAAVGATLKDAYLKALRCDSVSAFGGIIALNGTVDAAAAEEIAKIFTEVVIAPAATDEAKAIFAAKKNLRLLTTGGLPDPRAAGVVVRSLAGGLLVQSRDNGVVSVADLKVVSKRKPTERELADLLFAFKVAKHVKSNAIVYVKDGATVGIGAGQMSRVDSARIAAL